MQTEKEKNYRTSMWTFVNTFYSGFRILTIQPVSSAKFIAIIGHYSHYFGHFLRSQRLFSFLWIIFTNTMEGQV